MPRVEHILLALIACDIGLYIPVFPTVLHSAVAYESMQVTLLFNTFSPKNTLRREPSRYEFAILRLEIYTDFNIGLELNKSVVWDPVFRRLRCNGYIL